MVKKTFLYIFIYTLLIGCKTQNPLSNSECESDFTMNIEAPELEMDENGYYHIEWLEGYNQTFGEMKHKLKISIDHRCKAFLKIKKFFI